MSKKKKTLIQYLFCTYTRDILLFSVILTYFCILVKAVKKDSSYCDLFSNYFSHILFYSPLLKKNIVKEYSSYWGHIEEIFSHILAYCHFIGKAVKKYPSYYDLFGNYFQLFSLIVRLSKKKKPVQI